MAPLGKEERDKTKFVDVAEGLSTVADWGSTRTGSPGGASVMEVEGSVGVGETG